MLKNDKICKKITRYIYKEIPQLRFQRIKVLQYSGQGVTTCIPWKLNKNVHKTIYAGSLSSQLIITSWLQVKASCDALGFKVSIVLQNCSINYLKPVKESSMAYSKVPSKDDLNSLIKDLKDSGRGRIKVSSFTKEQGIIQDSFEGIFYLRLKNSK
ncbi:MAG: YiiD C-terminal domain-containing protein [Spirochaetaceae bacterium]|jgi:thioesterase domain-containing protein|nr:YiiD C-terminal domain-containing protein [Spirochaetaceae bacterium]